MMGLYTGVPALPAALILLATPAWADEPPTTKIKLNAGEEPEQKPWTQPASFSYISNEGAKDSVSVDVAGRIEFQPITSSTATLFLRGVAQVNTQQKKEVQNFESQIGTQFDFDTANHGQDSPQPETNAWYFFGDAKIGLQDKTIFADPKAVCTAVPKPAICGKQHETSLRGTVQLQPFLSWWEQTIYQDPTTKAWNGVSYSFSPVIGLFWDRIVSAKVNASGVEPKGSAAGTKVELNGALSPRFLDYRVVFRAKLLWTEAFKRDARRADNFHRSNLLYKVSVDYELGRRSFDPKGSKWIPAVGVSYTKGDDPLAGKNDQKALMFALKLTYKG